jgi:uncharacterized membrane protein YfcA
VTLPPTGQLIFLLVAGLVSGAVNAVAGGGSLLLFPALLAAGLPPLAANVTNSLAQWPGYVGTVIGARRELSGQRERVLNTIGVAVVGSAVGCVLLLVLPSSVFDAVVPVLVLLASVLLALSPQLRRWIGTSSADRPRPRSPRSTSPATGNPARDAPAPDRRVVLLPLVFLAAVYGGYFGGALGVILISMLSLTVHDQLVRLNAVKAVLSLVVATVTVVIFALGAPVRWYAVALLAPTTLIGGFLGARLARVLPEPVLRWGVVVLGVAVAAYLFTRPY